MGAILGLCVAVLVVASLATVLIYGACAAAATVRTMRVRHRPEPLAVALDRYLTDLLGPGAAGPPGPDRVKAVRDH